MLLHKERAPIHHQGLELLAEDTAPSNVQPRETRAGIERGKLYETVITYSQRFVRHCHVVHFWVIERMISSRRSGSIWRNTELLEMTR